MTASTAKGDKMSLYPLMILELRQVLTQLIRVYLSFKSIYVLIVAKTSKALETAI